LFAHTPNRRNGSYDVGPGASSQYVYDNDGHLIGEYSGDGSLIAESVWLGDVPVAVLKPASFVGSRGGRGAGSVAVFFVQPDQLDSPRVIVNASNTPVWRWDSAPFGDTIANEQPSGGAKPVFSYSLRFPGQQYDSESELHYNYFRDYEPGVGRYVQSDPIGLFGGVNHLGYSFMDIPPMRSQHSGAWEASVWRSVTSKRSLASNRGPNHA
jgi:RHS repeat-associated protein